MLALPSGSARSADGGVNRVTRTHLRNPAPDSGQMLRVHDYRGRSACPMVPKAVSAGIDSLNGTSVRQQILKIPMSHYSGTVGSERAQAMPLT